MKEDTLSGRAAPHAIALVRHLLSDPKSVWNPAKALEARKPAAYTSLGFKSDKPVRKGGPVRLLRHSPVKNCLVVIFRLLEYNDRPPNICLGLEEVPEIARIVEGNFGTPYLTRK